MDAKKAQAARLDGALLFLGSQSRDSYDAALLSDVDAVMELYKDALTLDEEDAAVIWARSNLESAYGKHVTEPLREKAAFRLTVDTCTPLVLKAFDKASGGLLEKFLRSQIGSEHIAAAVGRNLTGEEARLQKEKDRREEQTRAAAVAALEQRQSQKRAAKQAQRDAAAAAAAAATAAATSSSSANIGERVPSPAAASGGDTGTGGAGGGTTILIYKKCAARSVTVLHDLHENCLAKRSNLMQEETACGTDAHNQPLRVPIKAALLAVYLENAKAVHDQEKCTRQSATSR